MLATNVSIMLHYTSLSYGYDSLQLAAGEKDVHITSVLRSIIQDQMQKFTKQALKVTFLYSAAMGCGLH